MSRTQPASYAALLLGDYSARVVLTQLVCLASLAVPFIHALQDRGNDIFSPNTIARIGATTPVECLSEYAQMTDGRFWVPLSSNEGVTVTPNVENFQACLDMCKTASCQMVTYDYQAKTCSVRVSEAPVYEG